MDKNHSPACSLNHDEFAVRLKGCDCTGGRDYPPIEYPVANPFKDLAAPPAPTVVPFTGANIQDIAARLRTLADSIDLDQATAGGDVTSVAIVVIRDGRPEVYGLGIAHDCFHAAGILQAGVTHLLKG
jgi:hypothetical protein